MEIVSISDLHIGNTRLPPALIHRNLTTTLYPQLNDDLDILAISGDFFHTLLHLDSVAAVIAVMIIAELTALSKKHNFIILVLQGTFEHDRGQNKWFVPEGVNNPNIRFINKLCVEYIEEKDIWVLFIPDDLPYKNAQAEAVLRIKEKNIDKVDMVMMHGYCKYEIPKNVPIEPYNVIDSDFLSKYVKGPILKGHIHTKSIYGKVINNGSWDRWAHSQEETKGCFRITYDGVSSFTYKFIENKHTGLFKTINLPLVNFVEVFQKEVNKILLTVTEDTPLPLNIRFLCSKSTKNQFNPYDFEFSTSIRFSFKLIDSVSIQTESDDFQLTMANLPNITKENLCDLFSDFLDNKLSSERINTILNEEI